MHIKSGTDGAQGVVTRPIWCDLGGYATRLVALRSVFLVLAEARFAAAALRLSTVSVRTSSARSPRIVATGRRAASASIPSSYASTIPGWM